MIAARASVPGEARSCYPALLLQVSLLWHSELCAFFHLSDSTKSNHTNVFQNQLHDSNLTQPKTMSSAVAPLVDKASPFGMRGVADFDIE